MNKTQNIQLNQWDKSDRILMEDFNADNLRLDQYLMSCRIEYGNYVGDDGYGSGSPNSLTFSGNPLLVIVGGGGASSLILIRGTEQAYSTATQENVFNFVTWGENSVSWYAATKPAAYQQNTAGATYHYIAIVTAD